MNFKKSLAAGISLIALTSACVSVATKEDPNKCAGKNDCKGAKNSCKSGVNSCKAGANSCKAGANSCKAGANSCKAKNTCSADKSE